MTETSTLALSKKRENMVILTLAALTFAHVVEFMMIMPLGPVLMRDLSLTTQEFSFLVSAYNFAAALSGVIGLFWLDRFDRKVSLSFVSGFFALGTFICSFAYDYHTFLLMRFITGAFGGIIMAMSMTIISDLIPVERRGLAMGKLMIGFSLAGTFGVPIGLFFTDGHGWDAPFFGVGIFAFGTVFLVQKFIPSMRGHLQEASGYPHKNQSVIKELLPIAFEPAHLKTFLFMFVLMMTNFSIIPFISTYLVTNSGVLESQLFWVYLIGGLCTFFSNPAIGWVSDRMGKVRTYKAVGFLAIIPVLVITHLPKVSLSVNLLATSLCFIFLAGRLSPAMAMMSAVPPMRQRARFMGLNTAVQQGAAGFASMVAGFIVFTNEQGELEGFAHAGYLSILFLLFSVYWVSVFKPFVKEQFN